MKTSVINGPSNDLDVKVEIRRMRQAAKKATASKRAAIRFLVSTGMYTAGGKLKPQFR
jgi:hypothetical protein